VFDGYPSQLEVGGNRRIIRLTEGATEHQMTATLNEEVAQLRRANAELQQRLDERTAERDEALDQHTATAEVLGVINNSPGDLAPVFDTILEKAMRLCEAAFGLLQIREGDHFRTAAARGVPAAFAEFRRGNAPVEGPGSLGGRVMAGERIVHVVDLKDDEPYRSGDANRRALLPYRLYAMKRYSASSSSIGRKCGHSRISRSHSYRISPLRP
jgi:hypothetical protein